VDTVPVCHDVDMTMLRNIAFLTWLIVVSAAAAQEDRPNILWIIAEDLGPELGCLGTPEVRTPNIDRLAGEGVLFTNAFTVTPVCSTSRSSFMTGMYASTIGAHNHRSHRDDGFMLPEGVRVLTDWLRDAGYFTANIRQLSDDPKETFYRGTGKTDWNFTYKDVHGNRPFDSGLWSDLKDNQPFYAQVNFPETHRGRAWNNAHKHIDKPANPDHVVVPPYYPDHPLVREDWAQYLNAVMALDKKVGSVLDRLDEDGLAENTVVMFVGDHGRAMVRGKQWPYDSGLHVPMIIRWPQGAGRPDGFAPGTRDDRLIESIDWAAQALAIAGVDKPQCMQGRVFLGEHAEGERVYAFGMRDRGDETVDRIRTVRDARYRYIRNFMPERSFLQLNRYKERMYPVIALMRKMHARGELDEVQSVLLAPTRPAEELYDTIADPYETVNLVDSPAHEQALRRLRARLDRWILETDDQGRFPEPPEVIEYWEKRMRENYDKKGG
jgi:N-sulfoglucosamine sulfohydrolase